MTHLQEIEEQSYCTSFTLDLFSGVVSNWCNDCDDYVVREDCNKIGEKWSPYCKRHDYLRSEVFLSNKDVQFKTKAQEVATLAKDLKVPCLPEKDLVAEFEHLFRDAKATCPDTKLPLRVEASWEEDPTHAWDIVRIDDKKGFVKGNMIVVSNVASKARQSMGLENFYDVCRVVALKILTWAKPPRVESPEEG